MTSNFFASISKTFCLMLFLYGLNTLRRMLFRIIFGQIHPRITKSEWFKWQWHLFFCHLKKSSARGSKAGMGPSLVLPWHLCSEFLQCAIHLLWIQLARRRGRERPQASPLEDCWEVPHNSAYFTFIRTWSWPTWLQGTPNDHVPCESGDSFTKPEGENEYEEPPASLFTEFLLNNSFPNKFK